MVDIVLFVSSSNPASGFLEINLVPPLSIADQLADLEAFGISCCVDADLRTTDAQRTYLGSSTGCFGGFDYP